MSEADGAGVDEQAAARVAAASFGERAVWAARLDAWAGGAAVVVSLASVITCAGPERPAAGPPRDASTAAAPAASAASPALQELEPGAAALSSSPPPPTGPAAGGEQPSATASVVKGTLPAFLGELDRLAAGARDESLRVLWLGDSHTAADFMTDAARQALWERAPAGGPGFVRVGEKAYRHSLVRVDVAGKWHRTPEQPARRSPVGDGVFGPCGMRQVPESGASSTLRVNAKRVPRDTELSWTLLYRLPAGAALQVKLGAEQRRLSSANAQREIQRLTLSAEAAAELTVRHAAGSPEVFGVYIDTQAPGLTLDTCGIDGARLATTQAWDDGAFKTEIAARAPDLLVLAFGTNEAFDAGSVERYGPELERLVAQVRAAAPDVACYVVGPPDAAERGGGSKARVREVTDVQQRAAQSAGCSFVSARELMGGEGSFESWMGAHPPLARKDRIHLTVDGYEALGAAIAGALLGGSNAPR